MLTWSASLLGVQRGAFLKFAKSTAARRLFCKDTSLDSSLDSSIDSSLDSSDFDDISESDVLGEPRQYVVEDFKDLIDSDEARKKVHLILLEIASLREDCGQAPTLIREIDMQEMMGLSVHQRRKFYSFMFKREMTRFNQAKKAAIKREAREIRLAERQGTPMPPGLFPYIRKPQMHNCLYGKRLAEAALFGQKLVFDLGYKDYMTSREVRNLADQLQLSYAANKIHPFPFDFTFCNVEEGGFLDKMIQQYFADFEPGHNLIDKTSKHYLDLFPREKLIYLSPNAIQPLGEWDHSAIFIVGGIVDLGYERPLTLAKAKKEGIRCARFPITENLILRSGSQKTLTLNATTEILLSMKQHNDWPLALQHVPKRFVFSTGTSMAVQRSMRRGQERMRSFDHKPQSAYASGLRS